jgi:hypothetical protein
MAYNPSNPNGVASSSSSQPVVQPLDTATGNITTQNLVPTGTATANSAVEIIVNTAGSVTIGVTGTYTGALSVQATTNGTTWFTLTYNALLNVVNGGTQGTITSAQTGVFTVQTTGWLRMRVTALAAVTGTAAILLRAVNPNPVNTIASPLPTGTNTIGTATSATPLLVTDVASAAITSSSTTAAFTPSAGVAYTLQINVTSVSGTNPTLDFTIQESNDDGTNWYNVFTFARITTSGTYATPILPLRGTRIRYVQTVGGSAPSFTRSINRVQTHISPPTSYSQLWDRSLGLNSVGSTTPEVIARNSRSITAVVSVGASTGTATLQVQGSDDNGVNWYAFDSFGFTVPANTVTVQSYQTATAGLIRLRTSTAATTATLNYAILKAF